MKATRAVTINAPKETIWNKITDIEHAADFIDAIENIEILVNGKSTMTGFKWKETRRMFGKQATEIMWITDVKENEYYQTRAESHGSVYITSVTISSNEKNNELSMELDARAETFGAKIMSVIFGLLFKRATEKAILQDLVDIKNSIENVE